ncbi:MAG: Rrf2 family transcriptional regulator [Nitrospirae bacterium]|nr:Rrf2 family transcriptional regulator [Nitrospirota bacterium]
MQITRETDYAIRCVQYLSMSPDRIIMIDEISKAKMIPKSFLAKILQRLTKEGIVRSFRGVKGGFQLTKKPKEISILDVIVAIEGSVAMNKCAIDSRLCDLSNACTVHPIWIEMRKWLEDKFREYTFADLIKR